MDRLADLVRVHLDPAIELRESAWRTLKEVRLAAVRTKHENLETLPQLAALIVLP
jgi:hypothetical protein